MLGNKKLMTKEKSKTKKQQEIKDDLPLTLNLSDLSGASQLAPRITGIYGDINEEKCSETLYSLLMFYEEREIITIDEATEEETTKILPIDFYISTNGGVATEMFALYDVIRSVREECPIHTYGLGKVMSAGVLLLASGTKGERRMGKHCRVMIHGVISGQHGHLHDVENEFEEAKITQKLYIKALSEETNMTERYLRKLVGRKTNVYIDAEEAKELGIIDLII